MKLFQQLLVAGAAAGMLAPLASQASDVINIEDMNSYSRSQSSSKKIDSKTFINEINDDLAILKGRVDGLEAQQNNFEAGSFSETTTLDGKAVFTIGAVDADKAITSGSTLGGAATIDESTLFQYMYQMNLNTSFTGDDNLYVRLKSGNQVSDKTLGEKPFGTYLSSSANKSDAIKVDKMWYTMPVGEKHTFFIGPKIENYYMHATTPSIYKPVLKQFTLGGNASAYGASTSPGAGWAYNADNGFAVSSNFTSQTGQTTGMLTDESKTSWATQVGFTKPQYSVSAIVNMKYNGWTDSYFTTVNGKARPVDGDSTNIGLRSWWRPAETGTATPSISVGFDTSETDAATNSNTTMYFVGFTWQDIFQSDDRIGVALGQPQKREDETTDPFSWEAYYSFKMNDSVEITPAIFGSTDRNGSTNGDVTGAVLETTFKF